MHPYRLVITLRANNQIQNAIFYYNSKQKGLGKRFYLDLKHQLSSVRQHPFSRAIRYDNIRLAVLDKFPYAAHYNIENSLIIVHGVLSMFQDPETNWIR
jgi:hypothetical protein